MLYTTITVGEKELRLRLRTQDCVALEREIGKNPISAFSGIESGDLPTISNAAAILHAALQAAEHGYTKQSVYSLIDQWFEEGHTIIDLYDVLMKVFEVSGLMPNRSRGSTRQRREVQRLSEHPVGRENHYPMA